MSTHTEAKAAILQQAALNYLNYEKLREQADEARGEFRRSQNEMDRSYALAQGESRVVPTAPGEFVVIRKISRDNYEFSQALTNVVSEAPDGPDAIK